MSAVPDTIRREGGYITARDMRCNHRMKCKICAQDNLLYVSYGPHMIKHHKEDIFQRDTKDCRDNLLALQANTYLTQPIPLAIGKGEEVYWCLGCNNCFKTKATAINHFKKKKDICVPAHKLSVMKLRESFADKPLESSGLKNKSELVFLIETLVEQVRILEKKCKETKPFDYNTRFGRFFPSWGFQIDESTMNIPEVEPIPDRSSPPPPPPPPPPNEIEICPPPLQNQVPAAPEETPTIGILERKRLQINLIDPSVSEKEKTEIRKILGMPLSTKSLEEPPPPSVSSEQFQTMTPWMRFRSANAGMSAGECLAAAATLGIRPDIQSRVLSDTKQQKKV